MRRLESIEQRTLLSTGGGSDPELAARQDDVVLAWNQVMLDANAADHSLVNPDQGGPARTSRAFAIVSAAVLPA